VPSRTDLLHSYQFRTQRVLSALVMRETDPRQSPLRRGVGAVFAGIMVTILAAAGFGIYGLISKVGGDDWRQSGSVVVEKETGASFVYIDNTLYPTLNLASAMLAAGQPNPTVHRVASKSLAGVARGNPIGIPGAPDSLPPAGAQIGLPWTVCALTGTNSSGKPVPQVVLAVGLPTSAGAALGDDAVLLTDARLGLTYLIWHGYRHLIKSSTALTVIFGTAAETAVGTAWLNALPPGADIAPVPVSRRGERSSAAPDYHNGDVLLLNSLSGPQHYLVLDSGIIAITELEFAVINADATETPVTPIELKDPSVVARVGRPQLAETDPPATAPHLVAPDPAGSICATTSANGAVHVITGATVDGLARATPTPGISGNRVPLADAVLVPAGRVSVLRAVLANDATVGSYVVVTDIGVGYPVPDATVLPLLGYSATQAVDIPAYLANLIPAGPALDPSAAVIPFNEG
jgi:type VII secretion protein EccB